MLRINNLTFLKQIMTIEEIKQLILKRKQETEKKGRSLFQHIADQRFYKRMTEEYSFWLEEIEKEIKKDTNK